MHSKPEAPQGGPAKDPAAALGRRRWLAARPRLFVAAAVGIAAKPETETTSGDIGVEDLLLSRAADLGADLLVMGAYGHSRLREFVLGGVSRGIFHHMTVPVLMAH